MEQDKINAIVEALEKRRESRCDQCGDTGEIMRLEDFPDPVPCAKCVDGKVTDPQAQAAWEVMTRECTGDRIEECRGTFISRELIERTQHPGWGTRCPGGCQGSGRIPWNITEQPWPDGAVWGMLSEALMEMGWDTVKAHRWDGKMVAVIYEGGSVAALAWDEVATGIGETENEALADAFLEALEVVNAPV